MPYHSCTRETSPGSGRANPAEGEDFGELSRAALAQPSHRTLESIDARTVVTVGLNRQPSSSRAPSRNKRDKSKQKGQVKSRGWSALEARQAKPFSEGSSEICPYHVPYSGLPTDLV